MHSVALEREETLYERCWWVYAMCREHLFTDHTHEIAATLAPLFRSSRCHHLLEVGCGPGFYSRRLAARFPKVQITGVDLSEPLLCRAREQAKRSRLDNCCFLKADALALGELPEQVDAVIASRLFLILANRTLALHAIFHTLRPGGLCFIAEPESRLRAMVPLRMMQVVAHASRGVASREVPISCEVLSHGQFASLVGAEPWKSVRIWQHKGYQCAVCEKASA